MNTNKPFAYIRVIRGPRVTFGLNENGLARVCLPKAVSMDGCGDIELRDSHHADGDRFSERHQMDHQ
jgi:hypothetical protein